MKILLVGIGNISVTRAIAETLASHVGNNITTVLVDDVEKQRGLNIIERPMLRELKLINERPIELFVHQPSKYQSKSLLNFRRK
jgi:hypothetical protein